MRILIPAYEPGEKLLQLIRDIKKRCSMKIVIIDDGSGEACAPVFEQATALECTVIHHPENLGKGAALKTGFRYLIKAGETEGVVCADCDGQHSAEDICTVAEETMRDSKTAVLGARQFTGTVPLRSRFGNSMTRKVFSLCAGYRIYDTQTGLRGYPAVMLPWLCQIEGSRFEYEMNVLLKLKPSGYSVMEVEIKTIYENGNRCSHFRLFKDSFLVYLPFVKFTASSLLSGLLDFGLLLIFEKMLNRLMPAVVFSRVISSIFNYSCNRYFVFHGRQKKYKSAPKYFLLVFIIMLLNYFILKAIIYATGLPLALAKIITEVVLFIFSYMMQKKLVFSN